MKLTTTQHSALGDLLRFGVLTPSHVAWDAGGRRAYSRRTLQVLVDAGQADWVDQGSRVVPTAVMHRYDDCPARKAGDLFHEDDHDRRDVTCNHCREDLGLDPLP